MGGLVANTLLFYGLAAITEIAGCFAFWSVLRLQKPWWWLIPGMLSLILFSWCLTKVDAAFAGRAYAAYGGVYIMASLLWMRLVEQARPDHWDAIGVVVCLTGAAIILFAPRGM